MVIFIRIETFNFDIDIENFYAGYLNTRFLGNVRSAIFIIIITLKSRTIQIFGICINRKLGQVCILRASVIDENIPTYLICKIHDDQCFTSPFYIYSQHVAHVRIFG